MATAGYAGVIVGLSIASSVTPESIGPALYLLAALLTLPAALLIYPALFVNLFLAGALANLLGLGPVAEQAVIEAGVTVVFLVAALVNAVLLRLMWQSVRGLRRTSAGAAAPPPVPPSAPLPVGRDEPAERLD